MSPTAISSDRAAALGDRVARQIREVVAVPDAVLEPVLVALFTRGHVLIEGIPGIGKTLLARTLARTVDLSFHRIQFTNDLMPADIVGASVWRAGQERFEFVPGPLFANLVLADEFNRTSPRTLSCLLEAMEEGRITADGKNHVLGDPFLVLATRNPIEFHGTYPVPEAALDRFLVRVRLTYPAVEQEMGLYLGADPASRLADLRPVLGREELAEAMARVDAIRVSEPVAAFAYRAVAATRRDDAVALGASPRAALAWLRAARGRAMLQDRDYVLPDDLKHLAQAVLAHRVFLKGGGDAGEVVSRILAATPVEL